MGFYGRRVLLFGGRIGDPPSAPLRDTWDWDGKGWAIRQDMGPAGRFHRALAHDIERKRIVLFGGLNSGGLLGDTWELAEWPSTA
jgi:hypothetical protein